MTGRVSHEENDYNDRLNFLAEWHDADAARLNKFTMSFFPCDKTVELYNISLSRLFLRRTEVEGLNKKDMFVGNTLLIYGRQFVITDYADEYTKQRMAKTVERTFAIIKPTAVVKMGEVFNVVRDQNFSIVHLKMCHLTRKEALAFYESIKGDAFLPFIMEHMVSGPIVALELVGENAIDRWREIMGPTNPLVARKDAPASLRAIFGIELASNGFHGSSSAEEVERNVKFFFPSPKDREKEKDEIIHVPSTARIKNCTCCVIKPHALAEGKFGNIVSAIINSPLFNITAMQLFYLSQTNAYEFLEVYKGVVSDYNSLVLSFIDGPCIAMEISSKREDVEIDVHGEFRKFAGPADPEIARQIRPCTLRAMFGSKKNYNAVHCTDLPEDTTLELEYFFKILDNFD